MAAPGKDNIKLDASCGGLGGANGCPRKNSIKFGPSCAGLGTSCAEVCRPNECYREVNVRVNAPGKSCGIELGLSCEGFAVPNDSLRENSIKYGTSCGRLGGLNGCPKVNNIMLVRPLRDLVA